MRGSVHCKRGRRDACRGVLVSPKRHFGCVDRSARRRGGPRRPKFRLASEGQQLSLFSVGATFIRLTAHSNVTESQSLDPAHHAPTLDGQLQNRLLHRQLNFCAIRQISDLTRDIPA